MSTPPLTDPAARATSDSTGSAPRGGFADLVPELSVSNIQASLSFWRDLLGFDIAYDRPDARFAYLVKGRLQVMLCELNGRWETAEMQLPFGRGINFRLLSYMPTSQIRTSSNTLPATYPNRWSLFLTRG